MPADMPADAAVGPDGCPLDTDGDGVADLRHRELELLERAREAIQRLEKIDPLRARVVILKFFGDLTNQEVAVELGVTERSVERYWAFAKAWLYREVSQQV